MNAYVTDLILKNSENTVDPELKRFRDDYRERGVPTLLTESLNVLIQMATLRKPLKILEFGTSVGCSGIALLKASENATLYTIERYEKSYFEAQENFKRFGLSDRVNQFMGDALDVVDEVGDGFDFVFLDCNKSKYKDLYPKIKKLLVKGGILFADNVLFRGYITGEVKAPHRHNTIKNNMREFLRLISEDADFITTVFDVGDGIAVSFKK